MVVNLTKCHINPGLGHGRVNARPQMSLAFPGLRKYGYSAKGRGHLVSFLGISYSFSSE